MMSTPAGNMWDRADKVSPAPLSRIAAQCLVHNPDVVGFAVCEYPTAPQWQLSRYVVLPEDAADQLLCECRQLPSYPQFVSLLTSRRARLRAVDVRGLMIDADQLLPLLSARPRLLRLDTPIQFTAAHLSEASRLVSRLQELWVGNRAAPDTVFLDADLKGEALESRLTDDSLPLLPCPRLISFVMFGSPTSGLLVGQNYMKTLLRGMPRLTHLEISNVYKELDISFIPQLEHLRALVLHNVCLSSLRPLRQCSELRYLDISVPGGRQPRSWPNPDAQLTDLVCKLPHLQHLDIACTNLAGSGIHASSNQQPAASCDIIGLAARVDRPLKYLNIYGCNSSYRKHIPAVEVGGDISEAQVLLAAAPHLHHPLMMLEILDQMEALLQMNQNVLQWRRMLHLALDCAHNLSYLKDMHIRCAAVVQNVISNRSILNQLTEIERQMILRQVFRSVYLQRRSVRLRHFVVLILMNFEVPKDMLFDFSAYLDTLCFMLNGVLGERDNFVERVLIFLLNKTCCDVDGARKELVGQRGLIKMLLKAIQSRCVEHNCDEVMRYLWSCLWNVTDETPGNCQIFLENRGLRLFCQCLRKFKTDSSELVRNMMGLMGNIAEVNYLRSGFLTSECIETFCLLLGYGSTDLEISYHAGGVLANLLSDGSAAWTLATPARAEVAAHLERAVREWDVQAERAINYRSLQPIVRLLDSHQPESQLWATWALANLTHALPQRYGPMLCEQDGFQLMRRLAIADDDSHLTRLATACLQNLQRGMVSCGDE